MIDIKLRNVKFEDAIDAYILVRGFMAQYAERRGVTNGVGYQINKTKFYVYRTDKTVICVGYYGSVDK